MFLPFAMVSPYGKTPFRSHSNLLNIEQDCRMQLEPCHRSWRKLQHCSNRGDGATIRRLLFMRRTTTQAMCLHNAKQAGKHRCDAPVSEAHSTDLPRGLIPVTLAPGARIIRLEQAIFGYALEKSTHTHVTRHADTISCIDGMLEFACRHPSWL